MSLSNGHTKQWSLKTLSARPSVRNNIFTFFTTPCFTLPITPYYYSVRNTLFTLTIIRLYKKMVVTVKNRLNKPNQSRTLWTSESCHSCVRTSFHPSKYVRKKHNFGIVRPITLSLQNIYLYVFLCLRFLCLTRKASVFMKTSLVRFLNNFISTLDCRSLVVYKNMSMCERSVLSCKKTQLEITTNKI